MERCTCDEAPDLENREAWQWGGCGDNLKYSSKFVKEFLGRRASKDLRARVDFHNNLVGVKASRVWGQGLSAGVGPGRRVAGDLEKVELLPWTLCSSPGSQPGPPRLPASKALPSRCPGVSWKGALWRGGRECLLAAGCGEAGGPGLVCYLVLGGQSHQEGLPAGPHLTRRTAGWAPPARAKGQMVCPWGPRWTAVRSQGRAGGVAGPTQGYCICLGGRSAAVILF